MDFTGTLDDNQVEIFEGDIVEFKKYNGTSRQYTALGVIKYSAALGGYFIDVRYPTDKSGGLREHHPAVDDYAAMITFNRNKVVVGNVCDNPDMLGDSLKEKRVVCRCLQ